jgi:hypothetical protein
MSGDAELYALIKRLDRLEELREDLQEIALRGGTQGDEEDEIEPLDQQAITAEMAALDIRTFDELERRIAELNAQLDAREETIGEQQ